MARRDGMSEHSPAARPALLWAIAALGVAALLGLDSLTRAAIGRNEERALAARIDDVLLGLAYDNAPVQDRATVIAPELAAEGNPVTVYRARRVGEVVGVALDVVTQRGYQGPIHLLVGLDASGHVLGVRVTRHTETPGLGAAVAANESSWAQQFAGRTLVDPPLADWSVRRDGGRYDQLTGATVTSRAVVSAVRDAALLLDSRRAEVLGTPASASTP
jgi:Na+-translocating ferredoxin:NAD+ oxidoreductase subunit G